MLCGIGFSCESPLTLIPLSVLPWAFVMEVGSQEILQTLSAKNFAVILEGGLQSVCGGVGAESVVLRSESTRTLSLQPWWRGQKAQGLFMRSRSPGSAARASGASLPLASCPCFPVLPASHSSGWFHEQSWPFAPESPAGALQMSQFLAGGRLL